ncbi:endonuclease/exonuclease/phosphatase family metal-dependent hydrolase [Sphingomonas vulcanisoli]|uniref:Endonuclease/exonuclease/phosphatase family metal-dependent hydrolase n=1 Tax=Sphingomonas vulcanisoli TaxID=1658060 RepID=A0ABX0TPV2_9SPHN|nr:endonuclease/exonuclease/phosphatase family protein [Sphingomonas vulcanisoli]NIJ07568.1 endonuclease/exonuclease/phosphatase family metal-dependent hydrolase [Sphingomonas vulcanisoli]
MRFAFSGTFARLLKALPWRSLAGIVGVAAVVGGVAAEAQDGLAPLNAPIAATAAPQGLSVLTYNIEGLPAPFAWGRSDAARRIAARLAALRAAGQQPHVVVLQEAFGSVQQEIGQRAGYKYIAFGPDRDLKNDEPMSDSDRAFAAKARMIKGEALGKWRGSGLAILSDYPILRVKRDAFPSYACAGYDCMANKGVLLADILVPGADKPVSVIATHMNSKQASGVSKARFGYAFDRQVATIGKFLAANLDPTAPYIFAGDTNIGKSVERKAQLEGMFAALPRSVTGPTRMVLATCLNDASAACTFDARDAAEKAYKHGKDWQVYADGAVTHIRPLAIDVPFGPDKNGRMLSDHIGYTALYGLEQAKPIVTTVASL